jgi:hypothetical protein
MADKKAHTSRDEPDPAEAAVSRQPTLTTTTERRTADQTTMPADDPAQPREQHPLSSPDIEGRFGPPLPWPIMHV